MLCTRLYSISLSVLDLSCSSTERVPTCGRGLHGSLECLHVLPLCSWDSVSLGSTMPGKGWPCGTVGCGRGGESVTSVTTGGTFTRGRPSPWRKSSMVFLKERYLKKTTKSINNNTNKTDFLHTENVKKGDA